MLQSEIDQTQPYLASEAGQLQGGGLFQNDYWSYWSPIAPVTHVERCNELNWLKARGALTWSQLVARQTAYVLYVHLCVCREGMVSVLSTAEFAPAVKLKPLKPQRDSQSRVINIAPLFSPLISSLWYPLLTSHSLPILLLHSIICSLLLLFTPLPTPPSTVFPFCSILSFTG